MVSTRENGHVGSLNNFKWRQAQASDCAVLLQWRNDPVSVYYSKSQAVVSEEDHARWFANALRCNDTVLFVAELNKTPIATTRFDKKSIGSDVYLISINIAPSYRGKGMGKDLLLSAISKFSSLRNADLVADVHQDNLASQKIFVAAGFIETKIECDFKHLLYTPKPHKEND